MKHEFLKMQKLAGIITESQYQTKLNEEETVSPEEAVDQAIKLAPKLEKSPELDKLADKVANDPNLMKQLEKVLSSGGIMMNEELEKFSTGDMEKLALNFAKQGAKQEVIKENDWEEGGATAAYMSAFVGGGTLAAMFTKAIVVALPILGTAFAGPAVAGAIAAVALVALARKVYTMSQK
jgi:hypothetical protein